LNANCLMYHARTNSIQKDEKHKDTEAQRRA
jgi:hypothetical protein